MPMMIKNGKLALAALLCFCLFVGLGYWQLARARLKERLITDFKLQIAAAPLTNHTFVMTPHSRFRRVQLSGRYDNQHVILLDNKTFRRQVGYEIYTLFYADGIKEPLLVDRGFIAMPGDRQHMPTITPLQGQQQLVGLLDLPPRYVALGNMRETEQILSPMRVEYIDLKELSVLLGTPIQPYVVTHLANADNSYPTEQEIFTIPPERHRGYAVQWFALAATLLILFVALNRKSTR